MTESQTHAFESESSTVSPTRGRRPPELPDALAGFPSEVQAPVTIFDEHMVCPIVEPSEAERQRVFPVPAPIRIPVDRVKRAAGMLLMTISGALILASAVLSGLFSASNESESDARLKPVSSAPNAIVYSPPPAAVAPPPAIVERQPPPQLAPPRDATAERNRGSVTRSSSPQRTPVPPRQALSPRETAAPMNDLPSVPNWAVASALAQRTSSASITHPDTTLGRTGVALAASTLLRSGPPVSVLSPSAPPGAPALIETPTPSASPVPSTEEASAARNARTAAVQSVVDRYRDAFDALDANAVEGFWPSADVRALNRAFAQIDTQRFQFDRCDIQLAGARAIASCHGRAEYVRKAGSREARVESRQWTFTLAELKDRWVILGVDARPVR